MSDATLTMEQVDAPRPFVLVLSPGFSFDLARRLDQCCVFTCEVQEDGVHVIDIVDVPNSDALTVGQREMLALVRGLRFIESPAFFLPVPQAPRRDPKVHMAELRRKTGQDWRGRR